MAGHVHDHSVLTSRTNRAERAEAAAADRRWLLAALTLIVAFMIGEVTVGLAAGSLALIADAGHMLTDAAALGVAILASRIAHRPPSGSYTFGYTRVDAVSAQANGITLLILAAWFIFEAIRRLIDPPEVRGGLVTIVAVVGVIVNLAAVLLASRADQSSLNVRGAVAHVVTDLWAFVATAVSGLVVLTTGWARADALASLVVAGLMIHAGAGLIRASGRVFLEAAPAGIEPAGIGTDLAAVPGVAEIHDLHVWDLGAGEAALSAHIVVATGFDCHDVADAVRHRLDEGFQINHATLQADHRHGSDDGAESALDECVDQHGPGYRART